MKVKVLIGAIQEAPYGTFGTDAIVDSEADKVPVNVVSAWVANGWAEEVGGVEVEAKAEAKPEVKEETKPAKRGKASKDKGVKE